jgi:hypothetical protein
MTSIPKRGVLWEKASLMIDPPTNFHLSFDPRPTSLKEDA